MIINKQAFFFVLASLLLLATLFVNFQLIQTLFKTQVSRHFKPQTTENILKPPSNWIIFKQPLSLKKQPHQTTLSLKLVGTYTASKTPQAVLSNAHNIQKVYHLNDLIKPGITLKAIKPNYIIIQNQTLLEKLSLPEKKLSSFRNHYERKN